MFFMAVDMFFVQTTLTKIKGVLQHFLNVARKHYQSVMVAPVDKSAKHHCAAFIRKFEIWFQNTAGKCQLF